MGHNLLMRAVIILLSLSLVFHISDARKGSSRKQNKEYDGGTRDNTRDTGDTKNNRNTQDTRDTRDNRDNKDTRGTTDYKDYDRNYYDYNRDNKDYNDDNNDRGYSNNNNNNNVRIYNNNNDRDTQKDTKTDNRKNRDDYNDRNDNNNNNNDNKDRDYNNDRNRNNKDTKDRNRDRNYRDYDNNDKNDNYNDYNHDTNQHKDDTNDNKDYNDDHNNYNDHHNDHNDYNNDNNDHKDDNSDSSDYNNDDSNNYNNDNTPDTSDRGNNAPNPPNNNGPVIRGPVVDGTTVVDLALSSDDFSILVTALSTANLVTALSTSGPFTVFAPTNDAFINLMNALGITADELLAIPSLKDILLYHVVGAYLLSDDLLAQRSVQTLNGQSIGIGGDTSGIVLTSQQDGTANIIISDLEATNGVVHAVDAVLLPLFDTVVDIATSFDDFSILVTAVASVDLVSTLQGQGPFTVFAPPNAAFEALMDALGINIDDLLAIPSLKDILLYHVIGRFLLTSNLVTYDGKDIQTLISDGQTVQIDVNGAISVIDQQGGSAAIVLPDVQAKNGVVHVIDAVMLPLFQTVLAIAQSFDAFSILVTAVDHAGLTDALKSDGPFTVFAPPNSAFEALMNALNIDIDDLLAIPSLKDILLYHVIGRFLLTDDLAEYDGKYIETLTSDAQSIKVDVNGAVISLIDQQGGTATITLPDVQAKNGVVHVIDAVMLPLFDTVLEIAQSFDAFSILVKLVNHAGLADALQSDGPFTVFAPNNDAFAILLEALDVTLEDILNIPSLRDILLYHVIGDFLLTEDLLPSKTNSGEFKTLTSDAQTVQVIGDDGTIKIIDQQHGLTGIAEIILSNVQAKNGVAHVVNRVLLPLFDTVVEIAASFSKFSILVKAVKTAGLTEALSSDGPFTVFAPDNDAFKQLFKEIHIDIDDLLRIPQLKDILLYHVLGKFVLTKELVSDPKEGTHHTNWETLNSNGQMVKAADTHSGIVLVDQQSDVSNIGLSNVRAKNGVAHVIDRILIPLFSSIVQIARSFDDYSILVKLVEAAGLVDFLKEAGPYTVFAPNNKAFEKLMDELLINIDDLIRLPTLKRVLFYHMISDYILAKDLETRNYNTIHGQSVRVDADKFNKEEKGFVVDGIHVVDQQQMRVDVLFGNVEAMNGVVHVIQRVMIPLFDSIVQIAESFDDYSILVKLVHAAGLTDELRGHGPYTVFAPNNKAFAKLMYELHIGVDDLCRLPNLREVLWYHINGHLLFTSDFGHNKELHQLNGQTLYVESNDDQHNDNSHSGNDQHNTQNNGNDQHNSQSGNGHYNTYHSQSSDSSRDSHDSGHSSHDSRDSHDGNNDHDSHNINHNGFAVHDIHVTDMQMDHSNVIIGNVQAKNGIVHVVDRVLMLLFETVIQIGYSIDDYSILMRALEIADLIVRYDRGGPWTVFAPNNRAFNILMDQLLIDIDDLYALPTLRIILQNHVVPGYYLRSDLDNVKEIVTDHGQPLLYLSDHNDGGTGGNQGFAVHGLQIIDQQNDGRNVYLGNVESKNGVVFAVDRVHVLLFESIMQIARSIKDYTILVRLVEVGGLDPMLSDPSSGPYTVFAPNNYAFGILMDELLINIDDLIALPNLKDVLYYHLIGGHLITPALSRAEITLNGQEIYTSNDNNNGYAGFDVTGVYTTDQQHDPARVIIGNVEAKNGVVHVVDHVRILLFDSIVQIAASIKDYTILTQLVYAAGLDEMLIAPGAYTVFAPNNAAFERLMNELLIDLDDLLNMPLLQEALFNHIIDAYLYSSDLGTTPIQNLLGQTIYINDNNYNGMDGHYGFAVRGIELQDMQQRHAYTLLGNIEAMNGIVHVIDRVMIFLFDTVVDIATSFDDYSILVQLVIEAGLLETLSGAGPFTVFAPNNDAFEQLMNELHITIDDLLNLPNLADVLMYHILDSYSLSGDLPMGDTKTINSQTVYIDKDTFDPGYTDGFDITGIALTDQQSDRSNIFIGDIQANNGVVFVIDRVMIPLFDSVLHVATSLDDYSILVDLVVTAGLVDALSGDGPFTVFAPNNDAMYSLMYELVIDIDDLLNIPIGTLQSILLYHVVNEYLLSSDLSTGDIKSMNGQTLYISKDTYGPRRMQGGAGSRVINRNDTDPNVFTDTYDYSNDGFSVSGTQLIDQQQRQSNVFIGNVETVNGVVFVVDRVMVPQFSSIIEIASSFEDYSILVQLVVQAGLVDTLLGTGPFTVFAPNNDAMYQLMDELRITFNDLLNLPILTDVLLYHLLNGRYISTDLHNGDTPTINGKTVYINTNNYDGYTDGFDITGISLRDGQNLESNVFIGNVLADNGVVFVVDRVMIPIFDSIVQIATSFEDYSILVQLVIAAGLEDVLSDPSAGPFTVFAPNNYAFYKLMDELEVTLDDLLNLPNLADVLLYHVISGEYISTDLYTANYSALSGKTMFINSDNYDGIDRGFEINGIMLTDEQGRDAHMIIGNVIAENGIVHVIDTVLLPLFDSVLAIATSLEDFSILVAAVNEADLGSALAGDGPFTVFAPPNNAFYDLMDALDINIDELLAIPSLKDILLYHVVNDYITIDALSRLSTLSTLQGDALEIDQDDIGPVLIDGQGMVAIIDPFDVKAKNGIVHVINSVLLPLFDTVVDIATSLDAFSVLVAAVTKAGLVDALSESDAKYTVFAPTNDAFYALIDALGISVDELLQLDILTDVLLYHVISGHVYDSVGLIEVSGYNGVTITTMNGEVIEPDVINNSIVVMNANGVESNIILPDVFAQNGVVHVIDNVLLPPFDTVVDVAATFDEFSILVTALNEAGLTSALTAPGPFTVFAPTNAAFEEYLDWAGLSIDELLQHDALTEILLYHVIGNHIYTKQGLIDLGIYNGVTIVTLNGETLKPVVINDGGDDDVILNDNNGGTASIILADVFAHNGVVHVIDNVLIPFAHTIEE